MRRRGGGPAALVVAIGLLAGLIAGTGSSAAAAPKWSIVPTTNSRTCGNCGGYPLYGVSCPTATVCMATGTEPRLLVRKANTNKWSAQMTPAAPKTLLGAVSCATPTFCMARAVNTPTVIEQWNGTRWKVVAVPLPHNAFEPSLLGLSCTSPTFCIAVGAYAKTSGRVLVERWDGKSWSVIPSPRLPGRSPDGPGAWIAVMDAVSCTSTTNCVAVGRTYADYYVGGADLTLAAERWNGVRWSIVPMPTPAHSAAQVTSMSCTSASNCMAVGYATPDLAYSNTSTFAEQWNGTRWSIVASPNTDARDNKLLGLSCVDAKSCMAVGIADYTDVNNQIFVTKTLTQRWDGTRWAIVASPNPTPTSVGTFNESSLSSVSCTSPTACLAVGSAPPDNHRWALALAEQYG